MSDDSVSGDVAGAGEDKPAGRGPRLTRRQAIGTGALTAGVLAVGPVMLGRDAQAAEANTGAPASVGTATSAATAMTAEAGAGSPPVAAGNWLTTNQGLRIADDQNQLRAGIRGPSLLEDFAFREKIMHFDHERIPERVVHARGAGAHGTFKLHTSLEAYTKAKVLIDTGATTEVFVRFSTVNGSRGSADTARDARGFATKFYTQEGVWDLVGNNIPVFFIQDAIKFPDLVHAFKPEPLVEIPQASTAHDNFYDFISLTPEAMHMIMWVTSDRGIPRSYRMMEGFGIHTFRLVNAAGHSTLAKFHWKPALGVHSLVWPEAHKLGGIDPDFHRRDLADAINAGHYPQWQFGVQLLAESDAAKVTFDVLDATKLWPEEIVPVQLVGTMTLDRNPYNYFAETEQVAFHTGHIVSGIDFTDDPLLQGRLFSYLDTQINRFGGANFHQLPINQSRSPVNNFQQDSSMRYANRPGNVNYEPNSLGGGAVEAPPSEDGFVSYPEPVSGVKVRGRSPSFADHFSQATLFFRSLSKPEQDHVTDALKFELGKVKSVAVKKRMLGLLANVDSRLTEQVAASLGLPAPSGHVNTTLRISPALSQAHTVFVADTRKVAILAADGVDAGDVAAIQRHLAAAGVSSDVVAPHEGVITGAHGGTIPVTASIITADSVQYDALFLPGGAASVAALSTNGDAIYFIEETYKYYKSVAASGDARALIPAALGNVGTQPGVVTGATSNAIAAAFINAIAVDRHWTRTNTGRVSA